MRRRAACSLMMLAACFAPTARAACLDPVAVAAARVAAAEPCSCAAATDQGQYVRCVAGVAAARVKDGSLPRECKRAVVKCATKSTCGDFASPDEGGERGANPTAGRVACCIPRESGTRCAITRNAASCMKRGGTAASCPSCCDACGGRECVTATTIPGATTTTTFARPATTSTAPPVVSSTSTVPPSRTTTSTTRSSTTTTSSPQMHMVMVGQQDALTFAPDALTVRRGDTVRWIFASDGHNVVSGTSGLPDGVFCSPSNADCSRAPLLNAGATYDHTFTALGTFPYYCSPHFSFGMTGMITVQ